MTNKHVVANASLVRIRLIASVDNEMTAPKLGEFRMMNSFNPAVDFVGHPDDEMDVCVCAAAYGVNELKTTAEPAYYRSISAKSAYNEDSVDAVEAITFIGYPIGLYDQRNYLPIVRRGHTATPPAVDYNGKPMFLVDASVFPGSSGSPVLIAEKGAYVDYATGLQFGERHMFMGILAAVYQRDVPVLTIPTRMQSVVKDTVDIGIVYKARVINETVDVVLAKHGLQRAGSALEQPVIANAQSEQDALRDEDGPKAATPVSE